MKGSLLLAREGINGTIAGTREGIDAVLAHIRALPGCADLEWKESPARAMPFGRMKVRLKREIVTMGEPEVDRAAGTGHYVDPADWNELIGAPDVVVIDTRNDYEVAIGSFEGAIDPGTKSFREFPGWWRENAARFGNKRVAMFCTGGIRCEKSTNFLIREGGGGGLSPQGRNPEVSRGGSRGREQVAWGLFRLRSACQRRPRAEPGAAPYVPCLPAAG